jgi:hypothetical protein
VAAPTDFRLQSATMRDDGTLEVEVVVAGRGLRALWPKYRIVAVSRDGDGETSQPAKRLGRLWTRGERRVGATFKASDLGKLPGNHLDFFVEARNRRSTARRRIELGPGQRAWQPYPTVYGNLSVKRVAS